MTVSTRFLLATGALATMCLAVLIHILVVLNIPANVTHSAHGNLASYGQDRQFNLLPDVKPGQEALPSLDPAMKHAVCRFDLAGGPVLFNVGVPALFWSIGLFNSAGETMYSLNNRTAGADVLSMLVLTPEQLSVLRQNPPENLEELVVIETPEIEGFALLRAFVQYPHQAAEIADALLAATCGEI